MQPAPDTRQSLIVRLRDLKNESAWEEFVSIYRPVIVRVAVAKGLQPNDAEDLAQQVLISTSLKIASWERDPQRGRFRTWLSRVIRNAAVNALTRRMADRGLGGTTAIQRLQTHTSPESELEAIDLQWQREAFRWAADRIRNEFQVATWDAFWLTAVESLPIAEVIQRTGKSAGAIYVAKSRVMQRLQHEVMLLEDKSPGEFSHVD